MFEMVVEDDLLTKPDFFVETLKHIDNEIEFSTSNGRNDISDVLRMLVSLLEQQIPMSTSQGVYEVQTQGVQFHELFVEDEVEDYYIEELFYGFAEAAFYEWQKIEVEAMHTSQSWVQPVYESNREEEANLVICMKNTHLGKDPMTINRFQGEGGLEELRWTVEQLQGIINEEEKIVERMEIEAAYWSSMLDLAKSSSHAVIDFALLDKLLSFEAESLLADDLVISFPHIDGPRSKTMFRWKNNAQDEDFSYCTDHGANDSMSVISSDISMCAIITGIPIVNRLSSLRSEDEAHESQSHEPYLLSGSVAYDLYLLLLCGGHMDALIPHRFDLEHEMGILTMSDVFERLALLAKDIIAVQEDHLCQLERGLKEHSVVIRVTISLGQSSSVGIRFTYDLSNERCIIYCIPTEVFVYPVTADTAVTTTNLQKVANEMLSIEPKSNVFLLERMCSSSVNTLQGGNIGYDKWIT